MPYVPLRRGAGRLFDQQLNAMLEELFSNMDITHAERVVLSTYGDRVSVKDKAKDLNKFGRNRAVGSTYELVAEMQGTESGETFVSTNLIDGLSSSAAGDTSLTFTIEGHTIDGSGNLTFTVQNVTTDASDGRTKVALTTPLARATRMYLASSGTFGAPQAEPTGTLYVYDDTDGITAGVPNTASATKLMIVAGTRQSEKCGTSISSTDYWFLSGFSAGIGAAGASANRVTLRIERRDVANGGAWRPLGREIVLIPGQNGRTLDFSPLLIVPKNHDVRVLAKTDTNTAEVFAELSGYLAKII